ncbi:MAG: redoxin domain-containing protein [Myxococcales bacterium]|nr:redoxin domain-containing protein [Myxococcales bacterium]
MSVTLQVFTLALISAGGAAAAATLHAGAGVVVATLATVLCGFAVTQQNTTSTRLGFYVAVIAHAASIYLATRSPWLAAASLAVGLPLHTGIYSLARYRWLQVLHPVAGLVAGITLAVIGRGSGLWLLAVVPLLLVGVMVSATGIAAVRNGATIVRRAKLSVGRPMPEVELPFRAGGDRAGERFKLSEKRGRFVLLAYVRGDWCPVCHVLMRIITREREQLEKHDVDVYIITPSEGAMHDNLRAALGIRSEMLYDEDAALSRSFGLIEMQRRGKDVPLPVALLVGPDGTLLDISRPDDVTSYASKTRLAAVLARASAATPAAAAPRGSEAAP